MHTLIQKAKEKAQTALKAYEAEIAAVQEACSHDKVEEAKFKQFRITHGGQYPRRRCISCGLVEDSPSTYGTWKILTSEFTKEVSHDQMNKSISELSIYNGLE
jgi:hypothetical protein